MLLVAGTPMLNELEGSDVLEQAEVEWVHKVSGLTL